MFQALIRRVFGTKDTPPSVLTPEALRGKIAAMPTDKPPKGMRWCLGSGGEWTLVKIEGAANRKPKAKAKAKRKH